MDTTDGRGTHNTMKSKEIKDRSPSEKRAETDNVFVAGANNLNAGPGSLPVASSSVRQENEIRKTKPKEDINLSITPRRRSSRDINVRDQFNFQYLRTTATGGDVRLV